MLMNNLDPEVAEKPDEPDRLRRDRQGGAGLDCFEAIVRTLRQLEGDETLLVQSGKPVGVFRTHPQAPRVLIANALLVPAWATWDTFRELDRKGLTMFGQMTAGSWIYIGSQGILQGTYETFAAAARRHFGGGLAGRLVLTAGLGGIGRRPAARGHDERRVVIAVEVDPDRIRRRLQTRYVDCQANGPDEALALARAALAKKEPLSIALLGNAADVLTRFAEGPLLPDLVTDQTRRPRSPERVCPPRTSVRGGAAACGPPSRRATSSARGRRWPHTSAPCWLSRSGDRSSSITATNIRQEAKQAGVADAFDIPRVRAGVHPAVFCEGKGPFRWAALSGLPEDIHADRRGSCSRCSPGTRLSVAGSDGPRPRRLPGAAGAHLLAGIRRPGPVRPENQRCAVNGLPSLRAVGPS